MIKFEPGTEVECKRYGEWEGPFIVTDRVGRTPDHLVLRNPENGVLFEEYNDSPYNVRQKDGPGITLTRGQLEAWVCMTLTDEQVEQIEEAIPNSSIPEAIATIAIEALGITEEKT